MLGKQIIGAVIALLILIAVLVLLENDKEKRKSLRTTSEKTFNEQIAVKTAKTWKILNRDISNRDSFTIYEYVLGFKDERLVVRKRVLFYEIMDILPGDTVKVSLKADYKSDYHGGLIDNPYLYDIVRVKTE